MDKRLQYKVLSTFLNFTMSVLVGIVVPRAIGPQSYGEYGYIISTYEFIFQLTLFGANSAYIYFLSNERHALSKINGFFAGVYGLVIILVMIISSISLSGTVKEFIWHDIDSTGLVLLGLLYGAGANIQKRLVEYSDCTNQTILSEKLKLVTRLFTVGAVFILASLGLLSLGLVFTILALNFYVYFFIYFKIICFNFSIPSRKTYRAIFFDFTKYIAPLVPYTVTAAVFTFSGRFVLQATSGSLEQGYYNLAYHLATMPVIFITSVMTIYMSSMTSSFSNGDIKKVAEIFRGNIFRVYALHACFSFFLLVNAEDIITVTVGKEFLGSITALKILSIFSLAHTFGMLSGNLFLSSGRNELFSAINTGVMVLGILYFLTVFLGEGFDASGLAMAMTALYLIRVLLQLYFNLAYLQLSRLSFATEFILVTSVIFSVIYFTQWLEIPLIINTILVLAMLVGINYLFRDFLGLNAIIRRRKLGSKV